MAARAADLLSDRQSDGTCAEALTPDVADRIVVQAVAGIATDVSVTLPTARVIASSDPERVGICHPLARHAVASGDVAVTEDGSEPGVGIPLVYDDAIVGAVVLHVDPRRGREVIRIVRTLAELLIHQATVIDRLPDQKRLRTKFLAELLHGRLDPHAGSPVEAAIFDIDLDLPRLVAVIDVRAAIERLAGARTGGDAVPSMDRARWRERGRAELLRRASRLPGGRETDAWGFADERWLVLLAVVDLADVEADRCRIARRVQELVDDITRSTRTMISAGIGSHHPGWPALAESFSEACFAAETGLALGEVGRVFAPEELGFAGFLAETGSAAKDGLVRRLLAPLDGQQELRLTLEMFLRANLSSQEAARSLNIHRHTMTYRLDKIERLTGLDPRPFEHAAHFHAALWWRRLAALLPKNAPDDSPGIQSRVGPGTRRTKRP
jgi:carbohydrate diacid regulator